MKFIMPLIIAVMMLAACAMPQDRMTRAEEREATLEAYKRHAEESMTETIFPRVDDWTSLGREYLALRARDNQHYLVALQPTCIEELRFGTGLRIELEQQTRHTVGRMDWVTINGQRCRINSIWRVDHEALKEELAEKGLRHGFIRVRGFGS